MEQKERWVIKNVWMSGNYLDLFLQFAADLQIFSGMLLPMNAEVCSSLQEKE